MPYTFTLTATIPASAREIYAAWLSSRGHSDMTGGAAKMSDRIGAEVSAWDGYISGRNLDLVPGERIVQSWRTDEFGDEHEDSIITVTFAEVKGGTRLTLEHANVPDEQRSYEESGWQSHYFAPMGSYFAKRKRRAAGTSPRKASAKKAPQRAAKSVRQKPNKRKDKARRTGAPAGARKRAKPIKSKSGRGKRR
jgi:uncharacterized protein YndB with AHSA1/START domain